MMATKGATKSRAKSTKKKAPEPEVVDEVELEDDEDLEELDEDDAEEAPAKKKADEVTFGASDLAKYLSDKSGKKVTPRELRTLIRKMARDGSGRVTREITAGNRTRYNWSGPKDPEVKAIIKAFESGELEEDKQKKLAELKERKASKKKAKDKAAAKADKKKGKKAAAVDDEDEDLDLDDD